MNRIAAVVTLSSATLVLLAGCQTTSSPSASAQPTAVTTPAPAQNVTSRGTPAARVAFWETEAGRLQESLDQIEMQERRLHAERPDAPEPLTLQVQRDQTVALLLRARTELQNARFDQAMERAERDTVRTAELPPTNNTATAAR